MPSIGPSDKYQAVIERNRDGATENIQEYYDGNLNIGIATQTNFGQRLSSYCYYVINEVLLVRGTNCAVLKLNESSALLNGIFATTFIDGQEHILSPLSSLVNNPNLKFVYIGNANSVRGIQVDQWQACFRSESNKKFYQVTISYSVSSWTMPSLKLTPVQVLVESKADGDLQAKNDVLSITQFKPFINLDEDAYFTPPGVYCPGRTNLKPDLPTLPDHFRFTSQVITPLGDLYGIIETVKEEYNYNHKLFRYDYDQKDFWTTEVHDYNTGLNYTMNRFTGNCSISFITTSPSSDNIVNGPIVALKDPTEFFNLKGMNAQYVGQKKRDGVNVDVYIGKGTLFGVNVSLEWFFMSDSWRVNDGIKYPDGYQLPIGAKFYLTLPGIIGNSVKSNDIFGFQTVRFRLESYDISLCQQETDQKHYMFSLKSTNLDFLKSSHFLRTA